MIRHLRALMNIFVVIQISWPSLSSALQRKLDITFFDSTIRVRVLFTFYSLQYLFPLHTHKKSPCSIRRSLNIVAVMTFIPQSIYLFMQAISTLLPAWRFNFQPKDPVGRVSWFQPNAKGLLLIAPFKPSIRSTNRRASLKTELQMTGDLIG